MSENGRPITTLEATVRTAGVEVKVLTIGRKQVTLAVFRQLQREDIVGWDTQEPYLRGVPWGWVNYFWDGCGEPIFDHLHVVWQRLCGCGCGWAHGELRRACVADPRHVPGRGYRRVFDDLMALDQLFIAV